MTPEELAIASMIGSSLSVLCSLGGLAILQSHERVSDILGDVAVALIFYAGACLLVAAAMAVFG